MKNQKNKKERENKRIKILYIMEYFGTGGAERNLINLCTNLNKKFKPILLILRKKQGYSNKIKKAGINIIELNILNWNNPFKFISNIKNVVNIIKKINPDIIHSQLWLGNFVARIAGNLLKKPVISAERSMGFSKTLYHKLIDHILSYSTFKIIVNSISLREFTRKQELINKNKFKIIYNGVDLNVFLKNKYKNIRKEFNIKKDDLLFVNVSRLIGTKGIDYLIYAFKKLIDDFNSSASKIKKSNPKLILVGDGPYKEKLKKITKALKLNNNIIFAGTRKDVPDILNSADIFVFPSFTEGHPNAIIEAMGFSLPIIGFNTYGVNESVLNKKTGILVSLKNTEELFKAMKKLSYNKKIRIKMGKEGLKLAKIKFNLKKMIKENEELYINAYKKRNKNKDKNNK